MPSSPSRKENWSTGEPAVLSALGAEPSSGMRNRLEPINPDPPRRHGAAHTKTDLGET